MQELNNLLDNGVKMEDEFISTYMSVIKNEGFLQYFSDQAQAKKLLQQLIDESTWHKKTLENIIKKI